MRVTSPDVQGLFAWWQADDPSQVYRVASRYKVSAEEAEARFATSPSQAAASPRGAASGTEPSEKG